MYCSRRNDWPLLHVAMPRSRNSCGKRPCQVPKLRSLRPRACGRVGRNHPHSQFVQRSSHLRHPLVVHRSARLRRQPEMAAAIAVQSAEQPLRSITSRNAAITVCRRFLLHQLRVINLAGGVIQNHDQIVPALVSETTVPAAVDVQQHPRQRPPRSPLAMHSALASRAPPAPLLAECLSPSCSSARSDAPT